MQRTYSILHSYIKLRKVQVENNAIVLSRNEAVKNPNI